MGPTKGDNIHQTAKAERDRPRRGSLPELKTKEAASAEKKTPTGPRANPLYKTRLCMNFQSTGSCPYTEKCQFAHGVKELEKWENWRNTHKISDDGKKENDSDEPRSRSQSLEMQSPHDDFGSPQYGSPQFGGSNSVNWDMITPVKSSRSSDESTAVSNFSLWSSLMEDLEHLQPYRSIPRTRAATFDSTYDNMSQLRDAPTLFASPPIIPMPDFSSH